MNQTEINKLDVHMNSEIFVSPRHIKRSRKKFTTLLKLLCFFNGSKVVSACLLCLFIKCKISPALELSRPKRVDGKLFSKWRFHSREEFDDDIRHNVKIVIDWQSSFFCSMLRESVAWCSLNAELRLEIMSQCFCY